jgi:hypothetical protein
MTFYVVLSAGDAVEQEQDHRNECKTSARAQGQKEKCESSHSDEPPLIPPYRKLDSRSDDPIDIHVAI